MHILQYFTYFFEITYEFFTRIIYTNFYPIHTLTKKFNGNTHRIFGLGEDQVIKIPKA